MINDKAVKSGSDLVDPIAQTPIGEKVKVTYFRERQQHEAAVVVADRLKIFPDRAEIDAKTPDANGTAPTDFGLHAEELTPERSRRAEYESHHGVIVTQVAPVSFAEDIGFLRGDLIEEINHLAVNSMDDYLKAVSKFKPGQEAVFKVVRHGDSERLLTIFLAGVVPTPGY